jgi:molybdopterin-guanine dinucleotide biosynthesis protein A
MQTVNPAPLFGILIGGLGSRMGGRAKGLLKRSTGESLLQHLIDLCRTVCPDSSVVLLGEHAAYSEMLLETLPDLPAGIGPLGGVAALLSAAVYGTKREPALRSNSAVVLGCDLPYLNVSLLTRLVMHPSERAVSVQMDGRWNPVFARYPLPAALAAVEAQISAGQQSMQRLLHTLGAEALPLLDTDLAALRDWDTEEDMQRS